MKVQFQPERLTKLAIRLNEIGNRGQIFPLSKNAPMMLIENQWVRNLPICMGAISEISKVFPDDWFCSSQGQFYWRRDRSKKTLISACCFFGLDIQMFHHLFVPLKQNIPMFGGTILSNAVLNKDIAYNIMELVNSFDNALKLHPEIDIFISKN